MPGLLSPPLFAYFSCTLGGNAQRSGYLLLNAAITEFRVMFLACVIQVAENEGANLLLPAHASAIIDDGRLCRNESSARARIKQIEGEHLKTWTLVHQ